MKRHPSFGSRGGFSLVETVIALGVLVVLLTSFMAVFSPAILGIRRTINVQEADRLVSAARQELEILRPGEEARQTSFLKAQEWIEKSHAAETALVVYQYRGAITGAARADGTANRYTGAGGIAGVDFSVQPMMRRIGDAALKEDFEALEGRAFVVKMRQLIPSTDPAGARLVASPTPGTLVMVETSAVLALVAEFYELPSTKHEYLENSAFTGAEKGLFMRMDGRVVRPLFSRNLAVRR